MSKVLTPIIFDIETTGLSPLDSRIVAIGIAKLPAKQVLINEDEKAMIQEFLSFLHENVVLVGYNINNFDIPFITARALKHGLYEEIAIIREVYRVDLMTLVSRYLLTNQKYIKLKEICQFLDIEVNDDINGNDTPQLWEQGNYQAIIDHCMSDIEITEKLFFKLESLALHNLKVRYGLKDVEFGW